MVIDTENRFSCIAGLLFDPFAAFIAAKHNPKLRFFDSVAGFGVSAVRLSDISTHGTN